MWIINRISFGLLLLVMNCSSTQNANISENELWTILSPKQEEENEALPTKYKMLELDISLLDERLSKSETPTISIPTPEGDFIKVKLEDAGTMSPALAAKFPNIKSYQGKEVENNATTIRMDKNPSGLYAMITRNGQVYYINPVEKGSFRYVVYEKKYAKKGSNPFADQIIK